MKYAWPINVKMILIASNLKKSNFLKNGYNFFGAGLLIIFLSVPSASQSIRKERVEYLIKELTPTHQIKKSYQNIEIFGFDVLDRDKNRIKFSKFSFYPGDRFHIVFYGKRKITGGLVSEENKLSNIKAFFIHQDGGFFWCLKTNYLSGEQETEEIKEDWEIGGIYKIRFDFKVPEYSLPGKYVLRISKEKTFHPSQSIISFNKIKIDVKKTNKKIEDYNLSIDGCLLNPAAYGYKFISLLWTGNIEYFIKDDLKNFKKILIGARGSPALGIYPLLKIFADNIEIGSTYVNGEWKEYEFDLKLNKEKHVLKVRFDNDGAGPGEDRNLYVNLVKIIK